MNKFIFQYNFGFPTIMLRKSMQYTMQYEMKLCNYM